ncbi:MAG: PKD domain-containing protein [Thermoplasmata archaeon]
MATPEATRSPRSIGESTYLAVGLVGVALFVAGVVIPILASVPYADYVRIAVAALGGFLGMFGLGRWYNLRHRPGRRLPPSSASGVDGIPSLEIFSPPSAGRQSPPPSGRTAPRAAPSPVALIVVVLGLLVISSFPVPLASTSSATGSASSSAGAAAAAPAVTPVCMPPVYPVYGPVHGFYPPLPEYSQQKPCKATNDEVHATFSSSVVGSGERLEVPVELPTDGAFGQASAYASFYLGMVVQGNPSSVDGQSYAETVFTPDFGGGWNVSINVWSMILNTSCPLRNGGAPTGLNLTYDGSYACLVNEVGKDNGTTLDAQVPGGSFANVTMDGSATSSIHPLEIWFNDSTDGAYSGSYEFTSAHTQTEEFRPYYTTACPDACLLNWSMPFGLGFGVNLCDNGAGCFSYNQTVLLAEPPFEVGAPEFWTGLSYSGNYLYFSPESSTGACSGVGSAVPCTPDAFAGYYPYFTFNGTVLNFGANWSWATEDWGGAAFEFNGYATLTDYVPLFLDQLTNSSRADYVAPGTPLNVSVRVQDLGNVTGVNLGYTLPGASFVNETAPRRSGTSSDGTYAAAIPGTGANGTILFRMAATDDAGAVVALPIYGDPSSTVVRSAIPTFRLVVDSVPPGCGGVSVNGSATKPNGTGLSLLAGTYAVRASSCYPYQFDRWTATAGLTVAGGGTSAELTIDANGTLTAVWSYVRPNDTVDLAWTPSGCGATTIDGQDVPGQSTPVPVSLLDNGTYSLSELSCGGHSFSGWTVSNAQNLSVLGAEVSVHGNGTLTETSVPTSTSLPVQLETDPSTCGGVRVGDAAYTNNETLNFVAGTEYSVGPEPCAGYGYNGTMAASSNITVQNGELTAESAGWVEFSYYKLTLVSVITVPSTCGGVTWDGVLETNGALLNVTNHTVHSAAAAPCPGSYVEDFYTTGGLVHEGSEVEVDGPGAIEAVYRTGSPESSVGFITDPVTCGEVDFDGSDYANAGQVEVAPGTIASIAPVPCSGYGFDDWVTSGGVTISGSSATVNSSGSIEAVYHPLVSVLLQTDPASCGSIVLNGVDYPNGSSTNLPVDVNYPIAAVPCLYDVLESWQTSTGATIANGSLSLGASAIITAAFVPAVYNVTIGVRSDDCGYVDLAGVQYSNNSTVDLTAGPYSLTPVLCAGYELSGWTTSGGVNVSGSTLVVAGPGAVTEVGTAVSPTVTLLVPSTAAAQTSFLLRASVAVPVPPYTYNYTWSFGDGTTVTTPTNFTSHTYAATGTYLVRLTVVDPLGRVATAETNVTVVPPAAALTSSLSPLEWGVIGLAVAVVAVGIIVSVLRSRRSGGPAATDAATGEEGEELSPPEDGGGP